MKTGKRAPTNSVSAHLLGGVGNQLFNFAATLAYAEQNQKQIFLDISDVGVGRDLHGNTICPLLPGIEVCDMRLHSFTRYKLRRSSLALIRLLGLSSSRLLRKQGFFVSNKLGFDDSLLNISGIAHVFGYFQCFDFFSKVETKIKSYANDYRFTSSWCAEIKKELNQGTRRNIALHVRRGDYRRESEKFGLLSAEYYSASMRALKIKEHDNVWVFSDDINLTRLMFEKIEIAQGFRFVEPPKSASPLDSLILMSRMDDLVIANSSFSWWAAALSSGVGKVIAPKQWFKGIGDPEHIHKPTWLLVESHWENE